MNPILAIALLAVLTLALVILIATIGTRLIVTPYWLEALRLASIGVGVAIVVIAVLSGIGEAYYYLIGQAVAGVAQ
jgi:hypothetical protein